jgi:hypothetical protein
MRGCDQAGLLEGESHSGDSLGGCRFFLVQDASVLAKQLHRESHDGPVWNLVTIVILDGSCANSDGIADLVERHRRRLRCGRPGRSHGRRKIERQRDDLIGIWRRHGPQIVSKSGHRDRRCAHRRDFLEEAGRLRPNMVLSGA